MGDAVMRYILRIPETGPVEFPEYKDVIFALTQVKGSLAGLELDELDNRGNVRATLNSDELEQIVTEARGIIGGSVLLGNLGRTLESDG